MNIISRVLAIFAVLMLIAIGFQYVDIAHLKASFAKQEVAWQKKLTDAANAARVAAAKVQAEQDRINTTQEAQLHAAHDLADSYRADRDSAERARGLLQHRVNSLVAAARAQGAASAPGSAPADDPIGVLADMSSGADALAELYAKQADKRGRAGQLCERDYDALIPTK